MVGRGERMIYRGSTYAPTSVVVSGGIECYGGITIREQMALHILGSLLSTNRFSSMSLAVSIADQLIEELNKKTGVKNDK